MNTAIQVQQLKDKIKESREKLSTTKSNVERQLILDQIADYNRQIESLTKAERKIVPVKNAPIYMNRATAAKKHGGAGASRAKVPYGAL